MEQLFTSRWHRNQYSLRDMLSNELLRTVRPGNKTGITMTRDRYNAIKQFILQTLDQEAGLTINKLLTKGYLRFYPSLGETTGWYLYQVKLDLEARGLIKLDEIPKGSKKKVIKKVPDRIKVNNKVKLKFIELFHASPLIIQSPGRINLIGEHTDYNNGFVMPAAIDKGIQFAMAPSKDKVSIIYSIKYDQFLRIDRLKLDKISTPAWGNYFLGILYQFKSRGMDVKPFNCVFGGDLPTGAGLSSSAAIECGFAFGLNELNSLNLDKFEMILIAQWAEHNYVGVKCGVMDQFTSMLGRQGQVILLDCQWLSYIYHPLDLKDYHLVLCNSNVKHSLASSEYNTRRMECEEGVRILKQNHPSVKSLRDVSLEMLEINKALLPRNIFSRCQYVVLENERVTRGGEDIKAGRLVAFGRKMFETHEGLSLLYNVSCPELDFLVTTAGRCHGVIGSRMMGGGFGGCTLNIVHQLHLGEFLFEIKNGYKSSYKKELIPYVVKTANGTSVIENPF